MNITETQRLAAELGYILNDHEFIVSVISFKRPGKYVPPDESVLLRCARKGHKTTWCAIMFYKDKNVFVGRAYNTKTIPGSTDTKGYMSLVVDPNEPDDAFDALAHEAARQSVAR